MDMEGKIKMVTNSVHGYIEMKESIRKTVYKPILSKKRKIHN